MNRVYKIDSDQTFVALGDLLEAITEARSQIEEQGADRSRASAYTLIALAEAVVPKNATLRNERARHLAAALATLLYELTTGQDDTHPSLRLVR